MTGLAGLDGSYLRGRKWRTVPGTSKSTDPGTSKRRLQWSTSRSCDRILTTALLVYLTVGGWVHLAFLGAVLNLESHVWAGVAMTGPALAVALGGVKALVKAGWLK